MLPVQRHFAMDLRELEIQGCVKQPHWARVTCHVQSLMDCGVCPAGCIDLGMVSFLADPSDAIVSQTDSDDRDEKEKALSLTDFTFETDDGST